MEIIKLPSALLFLLLLVSCASTGSDRLSTEYSASDDLANKRFVLQFHNHGSKQLCLSPSTWPNVVGNIPLTSADISVSIGQNVFPLDTFIEDCRDCTIKVKPHSLLLGYLDYRAFKIPDELAGEHKELHLLPMAVSCDWSVIVPMRSWVVYDFDLYTYTGNDPLDRTDPTGDCPSCLIGALVEVGFEAYTGELNNAFSQAFEGNYGAIGVSAAKIGIASISGGVSTVAAARAVGIAAKAAEAISASAAATTAAKVAAVAVTQAASGAATQAANNAAEGKSVGDNVGTAAAVGAVAGTALKYAGDAVASKVGDAAEGAGGALGANLKSAVNAVTKVATGEVKKEVSCTAKNGSTC